MSRHYESKFCLHVPKMGFFSFSFSSLSVDCRIWIPKVVQKTVLNFEKRSCVLLIFEVCFPYWDRESIYAVWFCFWKNWLVSCLHLTSPFNGRWFLPPHILQSVWQSVWIPPYSPQLPGNWIISSQRRPVTLGFLLVILSCQYHMRK